MRASVAEVVADLMREHADRVSAGAATSLRFTIINQGTVPTNTPRWRDYVYLSLDNKLTGNAGANRLTHLLGRPAADK